MNVFATAITLQVSPLRRKKRASGRDDNVVGGANEEREEAGSLAPLGMTNQKSKGKNNGRHE